MKTDYQPEALITVLKPLASHLTSERQKDLPRHCKIIRYRSNESIYVTGDMSKQLYCLLEGAAKIYIGEGEVKGRIIRMVRKGDLFGYRTFFSGTSFNTSCITVSDSVVCSIPMAYIIGNEEDKLSVASFFLRQVSYEMIASEEKLLRISHKHLRGKLADALLFLADYYGVDANDNAIQVNLSREDLANVACMTTANAIRTLSAFASEGLIEVCRRTIRLIDVNGLSKVSIHE